MSDTARQPDPTKSPAEGAAPADLRPLAQALRRVRRRLRLHALLGGAIEGAVLGAGVLLCALIAYRADVVPRRSLAEAGICAGALIAVGALFRALRRIDLLDVAGLLDRSHELHDRLGSAWQFGALGQPDDGPVAAELRRLAVRDAARLVPTIQVARAAPLRRPPHLWPLLALSALCGLLALLRPHRAPVVTTAGEAIPAAPVLRLTVEPELIAPEREEVARLLAEALARGDEEGADILRKMQELLDQVERGELTRKEAFDKIAELEQRLMKGKDGTLEELRDRLRKAGAELGKDKLAKELGQALKREDLEAARKELLKLSQMAQARAKEDAAREKKDLAQALRRAAEPERQKDEWKDKSDAEKRTSEEQALREEERRLKKKVEENPQDEESVRRLKKTQRELERLQREKQERAEAQRELERLQRDMKQAAEEMERQMSKMTPEQRKALEQLAKDMSRMQDEIRKLQQQKGGGGGAGGQTMVTLGSIKQVLRRVGRTGMGGGQGNGQGNGQGVAKGQGQGQGQGSGQGQGQGSGQGQGQGQGKNGKSPMKDFLDRASGKGGDGDVLVEGEGKGQGDQQMMILGQGGDTPVLLPGLGQRSPGQGQGQGPPGQDGVGTQHDPNLLGDPTAINGRRQNTRLHGQEGAGPSRSETILGSAERGFANTAYRKVYGDYTAVSEEVMSKERVPPGYRFYVKRYFQLIKPRQ